MLAVLLAQRQDFAMALGQHKDRQGDLLGELV